MPQQAGYKITAETSSGKPKTFIWKDSGESLTQADVDNAPDYTEPTVKFDPSSYPLARLGQGILDPLANIFDTVNKTGKNISSKLQAHDWMGAYEAATNPIMGPVRSVEKYALTGEKPQGDLKSAIEMTGIPASKIAKNYENKNYPGLTGNLIGSIAMLSPGLMGLRGLGKDIGPSNIIDPAYVESQLNAPELGPHTQEFRQLNQPVAGPTEIKPFESLTSNPPEPPKAWNKGAYAGYPYDQSLPLEYEEPVQQQLPLKTNPRTSGITKPLTPEATAFDSIIPDRFKTEDSLLTEKPNIQPQQPELFDPMSQDSNNWMSQTIEPSSGEPRIFDLNRPSWAAYATQRNLPFDVDTISAAEQASPELANAAKKLVTSTKLGNELPTISDKTKSQSWPIRVAQDWFKSQKEVLRSDSPAGNEIAKLVDKDTFEAERISGAIKQAIKKVVLPLDKAQYTEFQQALDHGGSSPDPMISNALDIVRSLDSKFMDRFEASGAGFPGRRGNYWPRMYEATTPRAQGEIIKELMKDGVNDDGTVRKGLSAVDAQTAVKMMRRNGERLIDPQHQREMTLTDRPYRTDLGALLKHYEDMSHVMTRAETFGPGDIGNKESLINDLIRNTSDPKKVSDIMTQYFKRDEPNAPHENEMHQAATKIATAYYLSKFAITGSSQFAMTPLATNFSSFGKALRDIITSPKESYSKAEASGALEATLSEAIRNTGDSWATKAYGIRKIIGANRTLGAIASEYYAKDLFNRFKAGSEIAGKQLEHLTLENRDILRGQNELSSKQLDNAAIRTADMLHGRTRSIDLSKNFGTNNVYFKMGLLFKKFAFTQTKTIKDSLKIDPSQPLSVSNLNKTKAAVLLPILQVAAGELTGDTRAAISNLSSPGNAIVNRGKHNGKNDYTSNDALNRLVQDSVDGMLTGLAMEVARSVRSGKSSIMNSILGPIYGGVAENVGNISEDVANRKSILSQRGASAKIKKSQFLKGIASHVPYGIGSSIINDIR